MNQIVLYSGSDVWIGGNSLFLKTDASIPKKSFYIKATTSSGILSTKEIIVRVCGDELITLKPNHALSFMWFDAMNGYKYPVKVYDYFVWDNLCPITLYSLQTESASVYTPYTISARYWIDGA